MTRRRQTGRVSWAAVLGFAVAAAAAACAAGAGAGTRAGWWDFRFGFALLEAAAVLGFAGAVLSLAAAIVAWPGRGRRGFVPAVAGVVLGAAAFGVPAHWYHLAQRLPKIHDITTDTRNPPRFVAILPLRRGAPDSATYGGPEVAAKQRAAYPDIVPIRVDVPPARAFDGALEAARRMGWRIVAADRAEGRIEAVAVTRWFGFRDDVVIRVAGVPAGGSRVDIRSVSRVGKSDLGTNARRIRAFRTLFADSVRSAPP